MRVFLRLALPTAALLTLVVLASPPSKAAPSKPNVVLVLMDTLRAQQLGAYGYTKRKPSPNIDRFAAASVVWENTSSPNAWTVPSVASIFTGVDPQAHRTLRYQQTQHVEMDTLSTAHDTLAEQMKAGGYNTAAFLKSVVIDSSRGFSQGFDLFKVVEPSRDQAWGDSAKQLNDAAIPWLATQKGATKPFFLYMHFMDVHSPYKAPQAYYDKYKGSYAGPFDGAHAAIETAIKAGKPPSAEDWAHLEALYDAELEYFDDQFQRLLDGLAANGLDQNTIVVLTGDHGEAFWEHQNAFHGNLYQENTHVPVIVRGPGLKGSRLAGYTQSIDIAPTLADLAGVPKGKHWMGTSQADAMRNRKAAAPGVVYSEYIDQRMVVEAATGLKLILNDGPVRLYDLKKDPHEANNLAAARPDDVTRLRGLLDARFAAGRALGQTFPTEQARELSAEEVEMLRQLGYVE